MGFRCPDLSAASSAAATISRFRSSSRARRSAMRDMSLVVSMLVAASYIAWAAPDVDTGSHKSARCSMVLKREKTGSTSTQITLVSALGEAAPGLKGIGDSMTSMASASLAAGPVPNRGWVVGKLSRSVWFSFTGNARSSASRTTCPTVSGLRPDLARHSRGLSALISHSAARRASVGSGHAGRANPIWSRVGKRAAPGSLCIATSLGIVRYTGPLGSLIATWRRRLIIIPGLS